MLLLLPIIINYILSKLPPGKIKMSSVTILLKGIPLALNLPQD